MHKYTEHALLRITPVGRADELEALRKALGDTAGQTYIYYFVGDGGTGKTYLLEEALRLAAEQGGNSTAVGSGDIVDLYHPETHSIEGIQAVIADGIDPDRHGFASFRRLQRRFARQSEKRVPPEVLGPVRAKMIKAFLTDFNAFAASTRVLLRFDTLELLQHESQLVHDVCGLGSEEMEVRDWLVSTLPKMRNSVILLAGREAGPLEAGLKVACARSKKTTFQRFDLGNLDEKATLAYFDKLAETVPQLHDVPEELRRRIYGYTDGHPIRLSLMIHLILDGRDFADLISAPTEADRAEVGREEISRRLVDEVQQFEHPKNEMVGYLAIARKGLDADLLNLLRPDWPIETCQANLDLMKDYTFVKTRPHTAALFLHDIIAEDYDHFRLRYDISYPERCKKLAAYYEAKLAESANLPDSRSAKVACIHYQLRSDPWRAFWESYLRWNEEAVRVFDTDLDMQLRDELLRYVQSVEKDKQLAQQLPGDLIVRDAAVRWVRRFLARGEHPRAEEVGRHILESEHPTFQVQDPLYRGALLTAYAESLIYTGSEESKVRPLLQDAIQVLEDWQPSTIKDRHCIPWRERILGRAYNDLGYIDRQAGRNAATVDHFTNAIWRFRRAKAEDELANTLNNLGFLYACWGRSEEAEGLVQDAVQLRESLSLEYELGLSYNTMGLVYTNDGRPLLGETWCRKALDIFTGMQQPRGEGLARLALGLSLRKQGEQWKVKRYTPEQAAQKFQAAVSELKRAEAIFGKTVDEPIRLWEAYNELGSTYCDWGWLDKNTRDTNPEERYSLAVDYLTKSVEIAHKHEYALQEADACDDLNQVFHDRMVATQEHPYMDPQQKHKYQADAADWKARIESLIPPGYALTNGGLPNVIAPVEGWWLALGKLHLGEGVRKMRDATEQSNPSEQKDKLLLEAAEEYAKAIVYLRHYSPEAHELEETLKSIYRRLKTVRADRLIRIRKHIAGFADEYQLQTDLNVMLDRLDRMLGLETETAGNE